MYVSDSCVEPNLRLHTCPEPANLSGAGHAALWGRPCDGNYDRFSSHAVLLSGDH